MQCSLYHAIFTVDLKLMWILLSSNAQVGKSIAVCYNFAGLTARYSSHRNVNFQIFALLFWAHTILSILNPKRAGGGAESTPLRHFLLYLCRLLFFHAETSWIFFLKPCARFKTIFIKIGPRVMMRRCVIARWVQRKTDFPLKLHTNRVFCLFCLSGYTSTMFYLIYLVYLE